MTFNIGDRVKLNPDHQYEYPSGREHAERGDIGTVARFMNPDKARIEWGNGQWGGYKLTDLLLSDGRLPDPNDPHEELVRTAQNAKVRIGSEILQLETEKETAMKRVAEIADEIAQKTELSKKWDHAIAALTPTEPKPELPIGA